MMVRENNKFTFMYSMHKDYIKIYYIFVNKQYRYRGIAKQLVENIIQKAKKLSLPIKIDAYYESLEMWKAIGFEISLKPQIIDGHIQDYYDGIYPVTQRGV